MTLDFRSEPPPSAEGDTDPIPFTLGVWRTVGDDDPVEETHEFLCAAKSRVSGYQLTRVARAGSTGAADSPEANAAAAQAMWAFLDQVMDPDDLGRLDELLKDPEVYVDAGLLTKVSVELYQEYAGRPTRQQRRSSTGRSAAGRTRAARPSSTDSD